MRRFLLLSLMITGAVLAADAWSKVKSLKSGTELRIYKQGVKQPLLATFEDCNDESVIVATKKEELAVPKDQIQRLDARSITSKTRVTTETRTVDGPDPLGPPTQNARPVPSSSTSSNLSFGSKPDFETIYRATAASQP